MHALILKRDAALGEGTRRTGEVLAYLPDGVDVRELATALINDFLTLVPEAPATPVPAALPAAEAGASAEAPVERKKPKKSQPT